jgi:flagellar hook-associated protein 3 FlgL
VQPIASYSTVQSQISGASGSYTTYLSSIGATSSTITTSQLQTYLGGTYAADFQSSASSPNWNSYWSSASTAITNRISPNSAPVTTSVTANDPAIQNLAKAYTMISELSSANLPEKTYQSLVATATSTIQTSLTGLQQMSVSVGLMQNQVSNENDTLTAQSTLLTKRLDNLEGVDAATVASEVSNLQTQIETAYTLTSKISKLSLVNYL